MKAPRLVEVPALLSGRDSSTHVCRGISRTHMKAAGAKQGELSDDPGMVPSRRGKKGSCVGTGKKPCQVYALPTQQLVGLRSLAWPRENARIRSRWLCFSTHAARTLWKRHLQLAAAVWAGVWWDLERGAQRRHPFPKGLASARARWAWTGARLYEGFRK